MKYTGRNRDLSIVDGRILLKVLFVLLSCSVVGLLETAIELPDVPTASEHREEEKEGKHTTYVF